MTENRRGSTKSASDSSFDVNDIVEDYRRSLNEKVAELPQSGRPSQDILNVRVAAFRRKMEDLDETMRAFAGRRLDAHNDTRETRESRRWEPNPEQLSLLKTSVADWNLWRDLNPTKEVRLEGADLHEHDLAGANLSNAILIGAKLDRANLTNGNFTGANLTNVSFRDATLVRANVSGAVLSGADFTNADVWEIKFDDGKKNRSNYSHVRGIESIIGDPGFKRALSEADYVMTLMRRGLASGRLSFLMYELWIVLTDYGQSLARILVISLILVIMFGVFYALFPALLGLDCVPSLPPSLYDQHNVDMVLKKLGASDCPRHDWFTPFYFSVVTFTTLGYGDISPKTAAGEILVCIEVFLGYVSLGLVLSVLGERLFRRTH